MKSVYICSTEYQFPYHWCLLVLGCLPINLCFSIRKTFFSNLQTYLQKFRGALILTLIQSIWIVSWRPWILPNFIVHDYMYLYCLPLAAKGRPRSMNITFVSISRTVQYSLVSIILVSTPLNFNIYIFQCLFLKYMLYHEVIKYCPGWSNLS